MYFKYKKNCSKEFLCLNYILKLESDIKFN